VKGVEVGHTTLISGDGDLKTGTVAVRTGVTAVLPRGKDSKDPVFAGWFTLNGNGEMTVNASKLAQALMELGRRIGNSLGRSGERATEGPGLLLYRCTAPTVPSPCTYEPSLFLIA
jgi:L-aminopeptidase/D-esterase-like protein